MKLLRVHIITANTCGGILDGLDITLRESDEPNAFAPVCLIGPNGSGKSQFLQVLAEIFQSIWHAVDPQSERIDGNPETLFEIEYLIQTRGAAHLQHVRAARAEGGARKTRLSVARRVADDWIECDLADEKTQGLLPGHVVGYSSGDNETLSLPFLVSRSGYADEVGRRALDSNTRDADIPDTRLMLIDYGTNLEVLVANLLAGKREQRDALLIDCNVADIHSFRCIVQLAHPSHPKSPRGAFEQTGRKGIQLTSELEGYLRDLRSCATCHFHDPKCDTYIFDFLVSAATRIAFLKFWDTSLDLYRALHKLSMLNDLAIPKSTRTRFKRDTILRRFASRLPEPQDEEKVFRFEQVQFLAKERGRVDYVSLSDGEHQLTQLLGTLMMQSSPGDLFLLDEPESHFNPKWRVNCISRILSLPTDDGVRQIDASPAARQECILTTHAPFVPCDIPRERVLIFSKDVSIVDVRRPNKETYGAEFHDILEECFNVVPPISKVPRDDIDRHKNSVNIEELESAIDRLGDSVQRSLLIDQLLQLKDAESKI